MKKKVHLSIFCKVLTLLVIGIMVAVIITEWHNPEKLSVALVITLLMALFGVIYYPTSIETTSDTLRINHLFSSNKIPFNQICGAERCYPSPGGLRLCGSGGFLGYWGYFNDIVIGSYFGYYGDRSQCILLKLTDKKQYVISCEDPDEMVAEISARLQK
ncbi:MAG: hypothetical protein HDS55_06795 [Barnesiella sp.]|nr:hypothetical protein [Barnesiella sp.]